MLAHLADYKTSKRIARDLAIRETTVNKHLASVRVKWDVFDRYETARVYRQLCQSSGTDATPLAAHDDWLAGDRLSGPSLRPTGHRRFAVALAGMMLRVAAELGSADTDHVDPRFGFVWRIAAAGAIALAVGMSLVAGITAAWVLSRIC